MNAMQSFVAFLGRALLSIIFISSAIHSIADWQETLIFFNQAITDWLAMSVDSPFIVSALEWSLTNASALLLGGVIFELVGGLLIFLGIWVRLGAVLLILFLIPTTLIFHHFWDLQDAERQIQMINFMKNVSIFGGVLFILAVGKGRRCRCASTCHDKPAT
jgi:putative oxidoreductase